jgi:FlaA1/EpsC-like NDP-sugar epimerase
MVQHILKFDPIDVLVKSADEVSYNLILEELKEKEIYNMIVDLHDKTKMNMFLKSVNNLFCCSFCSQNSKFCYFSIHCRFLSYK